MPRATAIDKTIADAIDVFTGGFSFTRSRTHAYESSRMDGLWVMRDAPRKRPQDYRREEWVAYQRGPREVDAIIRRHTRGKFAICAVRRLDESMELLRDAYKAIGYRLTGTEPFFIHDLKRIPSVKSPATISRVRTATMAVRLGKATRSRPIDAKLLADDSRLRQYVAEVDDQIVGWVSSITVGKRNWVSNLYVKESLRRKGIGRALMAKMLREDREAGSKGSALLASHAGAKLYPVLGYRQIGELLLLTPKR